METSGPTLHLTKVKEINFKVFLKIICYCSFKSLFCNGHYAVQFHGRVVLVSRQSLVRQLLTNCLSNLH